MESMEAEFTSSSVSGGATEQGAAPTSIQSLAIKRCRQVHDEMIALFANLSGDITSSRRAKRLVAKTRVALKKETLESYDRRLREALRFLDSAIQLCLA
jgi:hypothetical protein